MSYPSIISTIDLMPIYYDKSDNKIKIFLSKRNNPNEPFFDSFALIGGFIRDEDGDIESAIKRIARDKIDADLNWFNSANPDLVIGNKIRDPRGFAISHLYTVVMGLDIYINSSSSLNKNSLYVDAFDINLDLAFDHNHLIQTAMNKLTLDCRLSYLKAFTIALNLLKPYQEFTLSELQSVYELLVQEKIDKKTFRRYIPYEIDPILRLNKKTVNKHARPAELYGWK